MAIQTPTPPTPLMDTAQATGGLRYHASTDTDTGPPIIKKECPVAGGNRSEGSGDAFHIGDSTANRATGGSANYSNNRGAERAPPAYLEYASDMLADQRFKQMSLSERGLLWTLKLECWYNQTVPTDAVLLARVLSIGVDDLRMAFTDLVKAFVAADGDKIICPDLDAYRKELLERRRKQSAGGARGAAAKRANDLAAQPPLPHFPAHYPMATPIGNPMATPMAPEVKRVENSYSIDRGVPQKASQAGNTADHKPNSGKAKQP